MARATYIHLIVTEDPNLFPVIAVATVKHELVTALATLVANGTDLESMPWRYVRMNDAGAGGFDWSSNEFRSVDPAGAPSAYAFWAAETQS